MKSLEPRPGSTSELSSSATSTRTGTVSGPRSKATPRPEPSSLSTEEIRIVKARSPLAWLRPVLLLLGFLAIGAVALMLAAYQFGRSEKTDSEGNRQAVQDSDRVLKGRAFDYTQSSEGHPIFRIRAEESRQDRDGTSYLTTVILDIFHRDGHTYTVKSDHARVHEETWEARLEGNVLLSGWDNLELQARALELRQGGQVLESSGAVEFRYPPELTGRASHLKVDRRNDMITLSGGVHIHSVPGASRPMRLDCQRLVYQRSSGVLRAVGEASLKSDRQSLEGHYLTVFLSEDGQSLESVRARWNVFGKLVIDDGLGGETLVEYQGEFLDAQPDTQDPTGRRVKLDGEGDEVRLSISDLTGLKRVFTGLYLVGHTRNERLIQVEGVGEPLMLLETLDLEEPFPLRQVCADRVTARFLPEGGIARVQLEKRVELNDTGISVSGGEKASLNMEDGTFRVEGDEVLLLSERGEVLAPRFSWSREKGIIRAHSGVRAVLADSSLRALRGSPLGAGNGPVQVEADEAYWTFEPPTFNFEGEVRAWRGESLLLANQLRGDEIGQKLAASGSVRTVWTPRSISAIPSLGGGSRARDPIEVQSERVSYLEEGSHLVYDGDVRLRQGRRLIQCQELDVELGSGGQAERMTCQEGVRMADPDTGRRIEGGERAVYTLKDRLVEVFGEKVELQDSENNRMHGRYVRYDLRDGTFKIRSRAEETESDSL